MPAESFATKTKRRLLGLLFIALVVALISLSIAIYNKAFTKTVDVTLKADHTGNQLILDSDVKERGIIVGSVKAVKADGANASVTLALEPSRVKDIPSNVKAQILPKTLFGEQYVSLTLPKSSAGTVAGVRPIKNGDVIPQDRSEGALEAQDVLGDLLPLLNAVQPAELNSTLTALATALNGRGEELGRTLVNLNKYLTILNPHTQALVDDLQKLGKVALEYNEVAPDIFATLQNLQTSVRTVVQKQQGFDNLLTTGTSTSNVVAGFLSDNRERLISVTGQSAKMFALLDEYSPEFTCLLSGISNLADGAGKAIYNSQIHLEITIDNGYNTTKYVPGNQPKLVTGYGPNCFGLPDNPTPVVDGKFQIPDKYRCLNDGAPLTEGCSGATQTSAVTNPSIGSAAESAMVNTLIAGAIGTTPNKVPGGTTLLAAPLMRGHEVVVK
ncbi:MCE family protein [uncultured Jatrophihabitans sp.]|uniref:MCE family protein n=1 Tax=uncultured Jatrophihabitans sp. TaxID=1610747 RepID=UPI0035C9C180